MRLRSNGLFAVPGLPCLDNSPSCTLWSCAGHGRAAFSVTLVDILDCPLPFVTAGQAQINVRPLTALLTEKSFEQQFHADGIDRGYAQRIANRGIISGVCDPPAMW